MTNLSLVTCLDAYGGKHTFEEHIYKKRIAIYGILHKDEAVLLVKDAKSLSWELPGGGKERFENDVACLRREFLEESGLKIEKKVHYLCEFTAYFFDLSSMMPWKTNRKFYIVSEVSGQLLSQGNGNDVCAAKFISMKELDQIMISKDIRNLLSKVKT